MGFFFWLKLFPFDLYKLYIFIFPLLSISLAIDNHNYQHMIYYEILQINTRKSLFLRYRH